MNFTTIYLYIRELLSKHLVKNPGNLFSVDKIIRVVSNNVEITENKINEYYKDL